MENDATTAIDSRMAEEETSVNENGTSENKQIKSHDSCNSQSPLNGVMNELIGELDYEEDDEIAEGQGSCKRRTSENEQTMDVEDDKLIVHCGPEEVASPILEENQSPMLDDKDEGEISDDDDNVEEGSADGEIRDDEELEEGEVKDPSPAATQQVAKQVCRFFNNGNCTWGNQCRFLHLSLKDHGCYSMFGVPSTKKFVPHILHTSDMPPVMPIHHVPRNNRIEIHRLPPSKPPNPPPAQSAWDYGLQCVKEALEISNQRKKQEFDYEEKKLNLNTEENERVADNKENYDYVKPSYHIQNEDFHMKREEHVNNREKFPPPRNIWNKQEESQGSMRRNKWRDKQLSEIQTVRARGDEWRDPWRRSQSPKDRSRKRDLSSCSSISSDSYSTRTSSSPYSSRTSSASSRSPSVGKSYQKGKSMEDTKRRKASPFHEPREVSTFKEKFAYGRKIRHHSRSTSRNRDDYRSQSPTSKSRSRSFSHSPSLSNVSSASSCSSSSHSRSVRKVEKIIPAKKPPPTKRANAPTRTLFEEMQRLVQHRQRADDQKAELNAPCTSKASNQPNAPQVKVTVKQEQADPEPEKPKHDQAKSIGVRRIKLMKQLRAVEDAIARKRQKFCL